MDLLALLGLLGLLSGISAHCPTSDPRTTKTSEDTRGTPVSDEQCLLDLPSIDSADCSDSAFAALADDIADSSDSAFAAKKNICSKRWSHCPETIVSKGTGTLSVAVGEV